ncbi:T9SS type A sorting domain-containing protein [Winogradskyella aquimaris]|uniref:T9SS type A sorting domain-containing protein n=1 Tax=Winogradskyella aquimaris TaxID=864074 RepID=A0ABU5EL00_9FLAO|nr:T9SS type A sorting domain-containing protein [Winogradskyella aquimaris]MDY2587094.1 T9SS type A sorting domain-containing protein [Winogradskyella aquimaris]
MRHFYTFIIVLFWLPFVNGQTNSFFGNGNTGFGGFLGDCVIDIDFEDSSPTETLFTLFPGIGSFNDKVVIYIDSDESGNFTNTYGFTDTGDPLRVAISGFNGNELERAGLDFPPGFEADYAIAFDSSFGGLWSLANGSPHSYIGSVNIALDGSDWTFNLLNADIGNPTSFKFIATYISGTGYRSNEAIGSFFAFSPDGSGNAGFAGAAFDTYFTTDDLQGGFGSTTSIASVWSFDGSWGNGNPPLDTDYITINDDITVDVDATVGVFDINASNTVTIDPANSLTIGGNATYSGDFINDGTLIMNSSSTQYSSLIVNGSSSGGGTSIYNRHVNDNGPVNGNDLVSAPVSGQAFNTFIANNTNILANPSGTNVLFGGFDNDDAVNPFELWDETDTTPLTAGVGYRTGVDPLAGSNLVSFEGTVNTSLVQVPIGQGTASILNLVGNPFPSYLNAQDFLSVNSALLDPSAQVIYGYNDSTNGTSADDYTIISALENTDVDIAPGQGFFVASNPTGGNLQFTTSTPDMRITSTDDDFIAGRNMASAITNVNINLSNISDNFITKIYFTPSSGLGLDPGYDASLLGGVAPAFALFSHLVQDNVGVPFATQAIGKNDYNDTTIALGVNANMGEQLTFSIAENTLPASIEVYLDDTLTSTSTLLNTSDYVLTPSEDLNGTGRFYLRFSNSALSTSDNTLDNISIYANQNHRNITIAGQLAGDTTANVYDIQGRLVTSKVLESNATLQTIDASNLYTGVYIINLVSGNYSKTEKIILK